jgi:hypothetical protein
MRNILLLSFTVFITSCGSPPSENKKDLFKSYYSQINVAELPLQFDCFKDSLYQKYFNDNIDDSLKIKFKPQGSAIFGRLNIDKDIVSIIYFGTADFYYPMIFTYSLEGSPIDTLSLYSGVFCDGFPGHGGRSIVLIDKNNLVVMSDTLWTSQVDSLYNKIAGTDSIAISDYKYKMLNNGHFKKLYAKVVKSAIKH